MAPLQVDPSDYLKFHHPVGRCLCWRFPPLTGQVDKAGVVPAV